MRVRAAVRRADRGGREREATETSSEEAGISTPEPDEDPTAKSGGQPAGVGSDGQPPATETGERSGGEDRPSRPRMHGSANA